MSRLKLPSPLDIGGLIYATDKNDRNELMRHWIMSRFNNDGFGLSEDAINKIYGVLDRYGDTNDYSNLTKDLDNAFDNNFDGYVDNDDYDDEFDNNPTGIANPADYMQSIKFTDSDEDGKPESVEIEKKSEDSDDPNVLSDERCKEMRRKSIEKMKNGWGETDVMKKKKKEQEQQQGQNK